MCGRCERVCVCVNRMDVVWGLHECEVFVWGGLCWHEHNVCAVGERCVCVRGVLMCM